MLIRDKKQPEKPLRKSTFSDIAFMRAAVMQAVDETFADQPDLASAEKARYSAAHFRSLIAADPAYVMVSENTEGRRTGFIIAMPDQGALISCWSYLLPEFRKGTHAVRAKKSFLAYWDHGRFHKVIAYTRPQNHVARTLMTHCGYRERLLLEKHMFGTDFLLFEYPLTKTLSGYAPPPRMSRIGDLGLRLRAWFS